jgi:predicted metal-dependent hydrolase
MNKIIKFDNCIIPYSVERRKIKYPRLEFKTGSMVVLLPENYDGDENQIIEKYKNWILKKYNLIEELKKTGKKLIHSRNEQALRNIIRKYVKEFSNELNVKANKINLKTLNSKWGSCSPEGNLTFNTHIKYIPQGLIKYIIFHEVLHLKQKKHNKAFWNIIKKRFKDADKKEKTLFEYWFLIQT